MGKLRKRIPRVNWYQLVWHKDYIPRCCFICWLLCRMEGALKKIMHMGVIDNAKCMLCGLQEEIGKYVWNAVLAELELNWQ